MLAAGAADAVALVAVVLVTVVLADLVAPASLALALVLVHAVRLAKALATALVAALAPLLLLRRVGANVATTDLGPTGRDAAAAAAARVLPLHASARSTRRGQGHAEGKTAGGGVLRVPARSVAMGKSCRQISCTPGGEARERPGF